jgi:hypothetical protein
MLSERDAQLDADENASGEKPICVASTIYCDATRRHASMALIVGWLSNYATTQWSSPPLHILWGKLHSSLLSLFNTPNSTINANDRFQRRDSTAQSIDSNMSGRRGNYAPRLVHKHNHFTLSFIILHQTMSFANLLEPENFPRLGVQFTLCNHRDDVLEGHV